MRARRHSDGSIGLTEIEWVIAEILGRIPELLESQDPKVKARFEPEAYTDEADQSQWRELVGPELRRLVATRAEILRGDLDRLAAHDDGETFHVTIPAVHLSAWESALVGASHALFGMHDLSAEELAGGPTGIGDTERDFALLRIEVHSAVLHLLMRVADPSFGARSADIDDLEDEPEHGVPDGGAPGA